MMQSTLDDLTQLVLRFREEREWKKFHNPKDMALSLSLEVHELLEIMQWHNGPELEAHLRANKQHVGEELSDVLFWVLLLAHDLGIDLGEAAPAKMRKNVEKYPAEKFRGRAK